MPSRFRLLHFYIALGLLLISACTTNTPTETATSIPASPTPTPASQQITFTTPDGASIEGIVHGSGDVAVIFSVMGNCKRGWEDMADLVAQNGMTALTYQWRGCGKSGTVDDDEIQKFVDDLRGAITFMRDQGAKKIILVGASLGGCASAKLTVESQADGLVVLASPPEISQWGFSIKADDINSNIPKLFITTENDDTVSADKTRKLFDLAAEPKQWQTYPGTAHGTDLFETENGGDVQQKILDFILQIAST
ncbi:MAG: alpha/beta fold hydrolase [Anaerolineales bacterium]